MIKGVLEKYKSLLLQIAVILGTFWLMVSIIGCDAFVRKFTRKPKKTDTRQQEMVLVPEEYKPTMTKEQAYRQYYLFWKSWQDELIESLLQKGSQKKQIDCAAEAMDNLLNLRRLLSEDKQKKLDIYISQMKDLQELIGRDSYGTNNASNAQAADRIKKNISRLFSYSKVNKDIVELH